MSESCLICVPMDVVPAALRDFVKAIREYAPPQILRSRLGDVGRGLCWNCQGTGIVTPLGGGAK